MANDQAYDLSNFKKILSYYSALVKNAFFEEIGGLHAETPFMPESWTYYEYDTDSEGNTVGKPRKIVVANPGYNYAKEVLGLFTKTSNNIRDALMTLFINYDDPKEMQQEEFNFNILNAYASASQSLQWYNKDTEEFENMPEYWFTRGTWYDMLPMCTKGDYIRAKHSNVLQAIEAIKKCRSYYENGFVYEVSSSSTDDFGNTTYTRMRYRYNTWYRYSGYSEFANSRHFVLAFWNEYLNQLTTELRHYLNPIWRFGRHSGKPEQTASTAKLTYVTQLASDFGKTFQRSNTAVKTAKKISTNTGTYSAKKAKVSVVK